MINSIHKYMYVPMTRKEREAEERKKSLQQLRVTDPTAGSNQVSPTNISNKYTDKERSPLLPKDISIQIGIEIFYCVQKVGRILNLNFASYPIHANFFIFMLVLVLVTYVSYLCQLRIV